MKNNVVMVVNPVSGSIDKSDFMEAITIFAAKEKLNLVRYITSGKNDIQKVKQLYEKYKPERIIIIGGDGTIKMVAEAMENQDVILGILPAGSANGLAVDLDLMKTVDENLEIAFYGKYIKLDTIDINGKKCYHLSDLGLNAELVKNYENSHVHGKWGYLLQALNTLIDLGEPFLATITANNQIIKSEGRMIVIANSKKYGTGITINPKGVMNDGKFELVIIKNLDLITFGKIITGNISENSEYIEIISTDEATIKTNIPVSFQIDGEYCGDVKKLNIKIASQIIKVAVS
ncbi:MAG: diacylglycerol kinase family protein [Flavobacterium sp.]|uniref:diacylglycerol/lipid kinase family protein n=1 Tax=Flavobacterium sp. TaxID=239 RepID=UPI002634C98F|nr:diacylglycerol kinase family protein [Flavobacterium sp.]MDD5150062.1 diacylglycerol kinase family protein [Flavobacterium sp.]